MHPEKQSLMTEGIRSARPSTVRCQINWLRHKLSCIADIPMKNQQASAERARLAPRPKTARNPLAIPKETENRHAANTLTSSPVFHSTTNDM